MTAARSTSDKMMRFFELAFQQTQISARSTSSTGFPEQIGINSTTIPLLVQNAQESFARTVLALIAQGQPLTDALHDHAAHDDPRADGALRVPRRAGRSTTTARSPTASSRRHPTLTITLETAHGPIPIADSLDPTSPNYMHWYNPDVATEQSRDPGCNEDPITLSCPARISCTTCCTARSTPQEQPTGVQCPPVGRHAPPRPQLSADRLHDWTDGDDPRAAAPARRRRAFYDLPTLRTATELVLRIPRPGFFSTPAFFANWPTNSATRCASRSTRR